MRTPAECFQCMDLLFGSKTMAGKLFIDFFAAFLLRLKLAERPLQTARRWAEKCLGESGKEQKVRGMVMYTVAYYPEYKSVLDFPFEENKVK